MTDTRMKRCTHCKVVYPYHLNKYSFLPKYNDSRHCPKCFKAIEKALKKIPIKFKKTFIKSNDYTREQLIKAQEIRLNKSIENKRILFNSENIEYQHSVCEKMPDPKTNKITFYYATWWDNKPDEVEVSKEVWWDIKNKKVADDQENYRE